jgi:hypothetical protein
MSRSDASSLVDFVVDDKFQKRGSTLLVMMLAEMTTEDLVVDLGGIDDTLTMASECKHKVSSANNFGKRRTVDEHSVGG